MIKNFLVKGGRLILYIFKGNFGYAFGQFDFTLFLQNFCLHLFYCRRSQKNKKAVYFDLQTGAERYIFNLMNIYRLSDYDVYLKPNYQFYSTLKGLYSKEIFTFLQPSISLSLGRKKTYLQSHFVTDQHGNGKKSGHDKYIYIKFCDAFKPNEPKIPFGLHPMNYIRNKITDHLSFNVFIKTIVQQKETHSKIFFGGTTKNDMYSQLKRNFPSLIDRNRVIEIIEKNFQEDLKTSFKEKGARTILLLESAKNRIDHKKWLETLGGSRFFISPPGFQMPFSHNLFEAMACGTIPIVQYGNLLYPPLENGVNCLEYNSETDLIRCIRTALMMDSASCSKMSENVIKYFDKFINPANFLRRIEEDGDIEHEFACVAGPFSLEQYKNNDRIR